RPPARHARRRDLDRGEPGLRRPGRSRVAGASGSRRRAASGHGRAHPGRRAARRPRGSHAMKISVLTIFPDFFPAVLGEGMIRAAREKGRLEVAIVGLRDFTDDSHRTTDDYPFGGGAGMIMKVEPIDRALESLAVGEPGARPAGCRVVLLSPQGRAFRQNVAFEYAALDRLVLVCGRYKGV